MNISSKQLQAFLAVAQLQSFTLASEQLHMTQPALSHQIRQLEDILRVKLFERTTRQVHLSQAGKTFLPVAERVISRLLSGVSDMQAMADGRAGRVIFAALLTVGASLVPEAMAVFAERYPQIAMEYVEESDEPIYLQVLNGDIDFGIGARPLHIDEVEFTPIYQDYLHFVCSPRHRLANRSEVSWHEIVQYPFIAMKPGTSMRQLMEKGFSMTNEPLLPVQTAIYQSTILGMVSCDLGISVLPSSLKLMFERNDVQLIPIKERLYRDIGFIFSKKRALSKAAYSLVEVINEVVGNNRNLLPNPN